MISRFQLNPRADNLTMNWEKLNFIPLLRWFNTFLCHRRKINDTPDDFLFSDDVPYDPYAPYTPCAPYNLSYAFLAGRGILPMEPQEQALCKAVA